MVFYQNYDTSFDSKYKLSGYKIGTTTNPTIANQLEEFGTRLNEGVKNVEIGALKEDIFDTIPKEHLQEIRQLSKITGSNVSMHAPLIDPTGFPSKEGAEPRWSEQQRISNEQQIKSVLERAYELGKNGNVPVVLHGGNTFSQEQEKGLYDSKGNETPRTMAVVNQDDGRITILKYEEKIPVGISMEDIKSGKAQYEKWDAYKRLESLNRTEWDKEKLELLGQQKSVMELEDRRMAILKELSPYQYGAQRGLLTPQEEMEQKRLQKQANVISSHINEINSHTYSGLAELHNKFEKFKDPELHDTYIEQRSPIIRKEFNETKKEIDNIRKEYVEISEKSRNDPKLKVLEANFHEANEKQNKIIKEYLAEIPSPNLWTPVKDFSIDQASETIANAAFHGYKKFGERSPVLAIENSYPNMPLATADELRKALEAARKKFEDLAVKEKHISNEEAKRISEKLIGATWDLGHMNMLRKAGYEGEELKQKILEETRKISPFIKHMHITDNFGFADTHLPPGMGNVPIKEVLEELERREGKRMEDVRHIIESGGFINAFKQNPFEYSLAFFQSPLYKMGAGPYWQQDVQGFYQTPYIEFSPIHFDLYGSNFSTLPKELGGQTGGGEKGRFMEGEKEQPYQ